MDPLLVISCAAHAAKAAGHHGRHFFPVFSPNWFDVIITAIICVTILAVSLLAVILVYRLYSKKLKQERWNKEQEVKKEVWDKLSSIRKEYQTNVLDMINRNSQEGADKKSDYNAKADDYLKNINTDYSYDERN